MMKLVPTVVTRKFGRAVLKAKKNSPHIYFAAGVVGVVGSTVLACRATLKLEPVLDEIKDDLDSLRNKPINASYPEDEHRKELVRAYGRGGVKLGRLYGPSVVLGVASIGALTSSHVQLARRNAAVTAAYAGLAQVFEEYRERVKEAIGEEKEQDIYYGVKVVEIEEDGKKKKVATIDGKHSPYARFFDQFSTCWKKDPEYNRYFLQCQQNYWNQRLHAYGHVFLNEVYDSLGLERSKIGQVVGWLVDGDGDGYIDFGLFEATENARFINNLEWSALLDFNVDGIIYDKI